MNNENNEFFQASHLMLLVGYSFFAAVLIGESILMGWEKWVLVLIIGGMGLSWFIHIRHMATADFRLWIYALLMMFAFFFYGIHLTSTFDLAVVMAAIIILYTMTGHKSLITLCQFTYFFTMGYSLIKMIFAGVTFDELMITRSALHCAMIIMIGWASKAIIDRLIQVYGNTREEIAKLTDATQRLNDFLANMSHELRTPINAVIGLSGVCIDREENPEIQSDMIAVRTAGRRVARQIGDILDFS